MYLREKVDNGSVNQIERKEQVQTTSPKHYSIFPDLVTGWRPRNMKISAPILITYQDELSQLALNSAITCQNTIVYVGPRYDNSYKFPHLADYYCNSRYSMKYEQIPAKLKKELQHLSPKDTNRKTSFLGMNPTLQNQLQFQSNFESGNLDFVVKVSESQYNLFLRPDTNTRGHTQWFYFKVCNFSYPNQNIKFNVLNNRKKEALYRRGMKPYVYSKHLQSSKGIKWQQIGENIMYVNLNEKDGVLSQFPIFQELGSQVLSRYYCLSFNYTFESLKDEVYFAYCPPFTYTEMKAHVQILKKKSNQDIGISVVEENLCTSLSGLQIPLLTITDQSIPQEYKKCVIVTGRFHPGESNGSYALKGLLDYLVSSSAQFLRKRIVFKIIPMINPDGVVFGNYRTSLSGKDLNRKFKQKNNELFPQITHMKTFVNKFKRQTGIKLLYFLDFHGHSMKKNVFMYGPEYDLWSQKLQKAKILPKLVSIKTDLFRYQSCTFRVAAAKKTTARAFMLGLVPFCYTIESSVGLYRSFNKKQNQYFSPSKWEEIGKIIAQCLKQSIQRIQKQWNTNPKKKKKNFKMVGLENNKQNFSVKEHTSSQQRQQRSMVTEMIKCKQIQKQKEKIKEVGECKKKKCKQNQPSKSQVRNLQSNQFSKRKSNSTKSLSQVKTNKSPFTLIEPDCPQINEVEDQSDGYSEGKSDCQSDDNDFNKEQYKKLYGKIIRFIENFNEAVSGVVRTKNSRLLGNKKKMNLKNKNTSVSHKYQIQEMKMVPSLKYKMFLREQSQNQKSYDDNKDQHLSKIKKQIMTKNKIIDEKQNYF